MTRAQLFEPLLHRLDVGGVENDVAQPWASGICALRNRFALLLAIEGAGIRERSAGNPLIRPPSRLTEISNPGRNGKVRQTKSAPSAEAFADHSEGV
jgi:hypothetical protein